MRPQAHLLLAVTLSVCTVSIAKDVEQALAGLYSFSVPAFQCDRLMTAQAGDIGCSGPFDPVSGALFPVTTLADVTAMSALPSYPLRAVLVEQSVVTPALLSALSSAPNLAGVLVTMLTPPTAYSPESTTVLGSSHAWNPTGLNILKQRYQFPVAFVNDSTVAALLHTKAKENQQKGFAQYPQQGATFKYYFGPPGLTSIDCIQQSSCLPLGGQSVWASFGDVRFNRLKPVVMATAGLDSTAMFHDLAFGGQDTISGLTALLAAATALSKVNVESLPSMIVLAAFQGETFGRIGSRRFTQEVKSFSCKTAVNASDSPNGIPCCQDPLRPDLSFTNLTAGGGIQHVIAVDQVGRMSGNAGYVHSSPTSSFTRDVIIGVAAAVAGLPTITQSSVSELPQTPVYSFQEQFPGINVSVLSDYDSAFNNPFYHSNQEMPSTVDQASVTAFATVLARSLYALASNSPTVAEAIASVPSSLTADPALVEELLTCFQGSPSCTLFSNVTGGSYGYSPMTLYPSVYQPPFISGAYGYGVSEKSVESIVYNYLAQATLTPHGLPGEGGDCTSTEECQKTDMRLACIVGVCGVRTAFFHDAFSPALTPSSAPGGYDINTTLLDSVDPLWTEPYWSSKIGVTGIVLGDPLIDKAVFGAGFGAVAATCALTLWLRRFARTDFKVE